jgi:hypothetical protein
LHPKFKKLFEELSQSKFVFYLPTKKPFTTANLVSAEISQEFISPEFEVGYANGFYTVDCRIKLPLADLNIAENESESALLFQYHNQFYTWKRAEDIMQVERFLPSGKIQIPAAEWGVQLQQFLMPLSKEYHVHFTNVQKEEVKDIKPDWKILLKEKGDYLLFQPVFIYRGYEVKQTDKEKIILPEADRLLIIQRNLALEREMMQRIESLHSQFITKGHRCFKE